ncbi:hypothetical protein AB3N02_22650 [Priestia aryabhattai]|uniref:hypothetical protein n=1 Tax=Priestia aryabhattai TaxID=412384 RepID=UPI0039A0091A
MKKLIEKIQHMLTSHDDHLKEDEIEINHNVIINFDGKYTLLHQQHPAMSNIHWTKRFELFVQVIGMATLNIDGIDYTVSVNKIEDLYASSSEEQCYIYFFHKPEKEREAWIMNHVKKGVIDAVEAHMHLEDLEKHREMFKKYVDVKVDIDIEVSKNRVTKA